MKILLVTNPKRGGDWPVPCLVRLILTENRTIFGREPLTLDTHHARSNLLKMLPLLR
jgi:hypothetical protein